MGGDPGWIDLAFALPLLDSRRARSELGWQPTHEATDVFADVLAGMTTSASAPTDVLRRRSVASALADSVRHGPVSHRART